MNAEGELRVGLEGYVDAENKPRLRLRVDGVISVACQRCLEPLELEIASERSFVLAEREEDLMDLAEEPDDVESLLAQTELDIRALAEDEVLLQIPMAPMHADDVCKRPEWADDRGREAAAFSVLGALKKSNV